MKLNALKDVQHYAFTLAEVLITLGIIGVVAALTMPSLIADKRAKELETALKKNASVIQQAILMITYEDGIEPSPLNLQSGELKGKIKPHLNVLKDCGRGTTDLAVLQILLTFRMQKILIKTILNQVI